MRRMDQQPLIEQEQAGELTRLEDRALAVLARHNQPDTLRSPLPVRPDTQRPIKNAAPTDPDVKPSPRRQLDSFTGPSDDSAGRDVTQTRLLRPASAKIRARRAARSSMPSVFLSGGANSRNLSNTSCSDRAHMLFDVA
jgi:hypothetical protein